MAVTDRFVTQKEAAELAACSKDTIIRARRTGKFPNARLRHGTWMIPTGDLSTAGLCQAGEVDGLQPGSPVKGVRRELADERAQVATLTALLQRQEEEIRFLRQIALDRYSTNPPGVG